MDFGIKHHVLQALSLLLVALSQEVTSFCGLTPDQLHTSTWKDFLTQSIFLSQPEAESLSTVMNQMEELSEIFNYFKQRYVRKAFRESDYTEHEALYSDLHFPWLLAEDDPILVHQGRIPRAWLAFRTQGEHALYLSAYSAFQKLAIALELVTTELQHNDEFHLKYGRYWRLAYMGANRVVEALYVLLNSKSVVVEPPINRSFVPARMRCMAVESRRNIRDWVILRNSILETSFYSRLMNIQSRFIVGGGEN